MACGGVLTLASRKLNINGRARIRFLGSGMHQAASGNKPPDRPPPHRSVDTADGTKAYYLVRSSRRRARVRTCCLHESMRRHGTRQRPSGAQRAREAAKAGGDETARQVARRLPATRPTPNADGASGPRMRIELEREELELASRRAVINRRDSDRSHGILHAGG